MGRCRKKNADTKKQNADRDEKMPMPFPPASVADAQCESRESKFQKTWVIIKAKTLKVKNHGLPKRKTQLWSRYILCRAEKKNCETSGRGKSPKGRGKSPKGREKSPKPKTCFFQNLDSEYIGLKKSENKSPASVFFFIALSIHVWPVFKKFKAKWLVVEPMWSNSEEPNLSNRILPTLHQKRRQQKKSRWIIVQNRNSPMVG